MAQPAERIEITTASILKVVGILLGLYILWLVRDIAILFFIVAILVAALAPLVDWLHARGIPRILAILLLYLAILLVISLLLSLIIPPIAHQARELGRTLPSFLERTIPQVQTLRDLPLIQNFLENLATNLNRIAQNVGTSIFAIFGGFLSFLTIVVLSFYLLVGKEKIEHVLINLLPLDRKDQVFKAYRTIEAKIGAWLRGQILLGVIVGVLQFIVLTILGVPFAAVLALFGGVLEIIPTIGPIIAAIPAILLALTVSPLTALLVLLLFLAIQYLESTILVPKIMERAVGLSPIIVIFALLVGGKLFGVVGAILAVPVAAALQVVIHSWRELRAKG